jgi:lipoate-protein ligase A
MAMLDALHVYAPAGPYGAAMNMAVDEALLETATNPCLRFYGWRKPAISFGYFGRFADVAHEQPRRDIVRRWTGGGIVYHGDDVTYSLVLPAQVAARFRSSRAVYSEVHDAIRRALGADVDAALATAAAPKVSDACFANAVESDVLIAGRKIAGAAQRRTRTGLLHQGSIQRLTLPSGFQDNFARLLCACFDWKVLSPALLGRAEQIAGAKYDSRQWLERR